MRFHVLGIWIGKTTKAMPCCAYSQKILNLCKMLSGLGHEVIHYGNAGSNPICSEHVEIFSEAEFDDRFTPVRWDGGNWYPVKGYEPAHSEWDTRAAEAVNARKRYRDFFLIPAWEPRRVVDAVQLPLTVEFGIGYLGSFAQYRVFESYPWQSYVYGLESVKNGKKQWWGAPGWNDAVIPNYYDLADFTYREDKEDHFAFFGRLNGDKGVQTAIDIATRMKTRLVVAGQGNILNFRVSPYVDFVGVADFAARNRIMGGARAVFVPTEYHEPFGGVNVEAQLCGTPVITTDWGVFSDTVRHGVTGFRCRNRGEMQWAAENIGQLKPADCRQWAEANFSLEAVAPQYEAYFRRIADLGDVPIRGLTLPCGTPARLAQRLACPQPTTQPPVAGNPSMGPANADEPHE